MFLPISAPHNGPHASMTQNKLNTALLVHFQSISLNYIHYNLDASQLCWILKVLHAASVRISPVFMMVFSVMLE